MTLIAKLLAAWIIVDAIIVCGLLLWTSKRLKAEAIRQQQARIWPWR